MYYLLLDKNLEVVERLTAAQLKERLNSDIKHFLLFEGVLNGFQVVEDYECDEQYKFVMESKKRKYYASNKGNFYSINKIDHKRTNLNPSWNKGVCRVTMGGYKYNVARVLAKLFIKGFDEHQIVRIKDSQKKVTVDNIYIVGREDFFKNYPKKKVGVFINDKCIEEYDSVKSLAEHYHYDPSYISQLISKDNNKGKFRFI